MLTRKEADKKKIVYRADWQNAKKGEYIITVDEAVLRVNDVSISDYPYIHTEIGIFPTTLGVLNAKDVLSGSTRVRKIYDDLGVDEEYIARERVKLLKNTSTPAQAKAKILESIQEELEEPLEEQTKDLFLSNYEELRPLRLLISKMRGLKSENKRITKDDEKEFIELLNEIIRS